MVLSARYIFLASLAISEYLREFRPEWLVAQSLLRTALTIHIAAVFLRSVWNSVIYPKCFSPLRHLPQPKDSNFFFGQWLRIFRSPAGDPQLEWMENIPNNGLIYYTSLFNDPRVLVTSPEGLREVLSQKSYEYIKPGLMIRGIKKILGVGVLFAEGDDHRRQRKNLMPAFSFRHVKDLYPAFWEKTRDLVLAVDKTIESPNTDSAKPNDQVNVSKWSSRATLDIIGIAGMGKSFNAIEDEQSQLYQTYQRLFSPSKLARFMGLLSFFLPYWFISNLPVKPNTQLTDAAGFIRQLCQNMIREKREKINKGDAAGFDILSVAIESGGFSDENLVDQMMTFLAAGHETTASSFTWAMLLLCQHPEVQKRLRDELRAADLPSIRDPRSTISPEMLDHIPYLNAVLNEVLRFIPPVPITFRASDMPGVILGEHIPPKTLVILTPAAINKSEHLWGPTAHEFDPDRWMGPGKANSGGSESNYAFMTFLHGPRSCIGQGFAKAEFAALVAGWVQAFETTLAYPDKEIEIQSGITQRPKGGLEVRLTTADG